MEILLLYERYDYVLASIRAPLNGTCCSNGMGLNMRCSAITGCLTWYEQQPHILTPFENRFAEMNEERKRAPLVSILPSQHLSTSERDLWWEWHGVEYVVRAAITGYLPW